MDSPQPLADLHSNLLCRYFSLQATNPLGFGDSVRMEIESNICREGGPLPDCFTTPLRQAWTTMEKVGLSQGSDSVLYSSTSFKEDKPPLFWLLLNTNLA